MQVLLARVECPLDVVEELALSLGLQERLVDVGLGKLWRRVCKGDYSIDRYACVDVAILDLDLR